MIMKGKFTKFEREKRWVERKIL